MERHVSSTCAPRAAGDSAITISATPLDSYSSWEYNTILRSFQFMVVVLRYEAPPGHGFFSAEKFRGHTSPQAPILRLGPTPSSPPPSHLLDILPLCTTHSCCWFIFFDYIAHRMCFKISPFTCTMRPRICLSADAAFLSVILRCPCASMCAMSLEMSHVTVSHDPLARRPANRSRPPCFPTS